MIELRTFGGADLRAADARELRPILAQPKRFALLTYLALAGAGGYRRRDTVVALFWPELDAEHARGALRQALRFLRRQLGDGVVTARGEDEIGVDAAHLRCDAVAFVEACGGGRHAAATELYRGEFLEGLFVADAAPEFERWIDEERARLRRLAAGSAWAAATAAWRHGDAETAGTLARRAAGLAVDDEGAQARLIGFLADMGDRAGALAVYDELATRLRATYDADPAPTTQALVAAIRARTPAPSPDPAPAGRAPGASPTGVPTDAGARPATREAARRPRTRRAVVGAVLGVATLLIAVMSLRDRSEDGVAVAVLPMEDLSGDTARTYVADGLTEQLITELAQGGALRVVNRLTMSRYRGSPKTARQVARELGADAVLASTLQQLGDTVHMTAQLILRDEDRALWAQAFEGTRGDLLRMQHEVARAVTRELRAVRPAGSRAPPTRARALDPLALDRYIAGRYWWNRRGRAGLLRSIELFASALEVDPTFALAYSGMADAYVQLGYGSLLAPDDAFPKAVAAARRALELDSTLAEPHAALAYAKMYYEWDWAGADAAFRRALALNPSYATAHEWYGLFLTAMGRYDEALWHEGRAQELDPLSTAIAGTTGWVLHYSGRQDDAERELRIALRVDTGFVLGHLYLGRVLQAKGEFDSALTHYAAVGPLRTWIPTIAAEGYVYGQQGRRAAAEAVLARMDSLSRTEYVTAYAVALVQAALGQRDSAFAWLDRAVQERTHWLVWLNRDLRWVPLRGDPRFQALVDRVGLPP